MRNKAAPPFLAKRLKENRMKIDLIDQKLLGLLNQRLRIVLEIGKIKKQMGVKIYDRKREKEVLERLRLGSKEQRIPQREGCEEDFCNHHQSLPAISKIRSLSRVPPHFTKSSL